MKKISVSMIAVFLVVFLTGCGTVATDNGAPSLGEITSDDFYSALYLMPAKIEPDSSIEGGLSIQSDPSTKEVRMEYVSSSDDVQVAIADSEALARNYDLAVLEACAERAEDDGDEQLAEQWRAACSEDESSDGLGRLYDEYTLYIVVDNYDGTLDLNGIREAGSEDGINWQ